MVATPIRTLAFAFSLAAIIFLPQNLNADEHGVLTLPATGAYNGFNGHMNVVECTNFGTGNITIDLTMIRHNGAVVGSARRLIEPNGTTHIILNDIRDGSGVGITNDIGVYRLSEVSDLGGKLSCLTAFYRLRAGSASPEYAFAVPVRAPLTGSSFGLYNSFDPSGVTGVPTQNWLTVYNPNQSASFNATVNIFAQDGNLARQIPVGLAPGQRMDFALAHESGQLVGLYEIVPNNATPYESYLARYHTTDNVNFNFAFSQLTSKGSCNETVSASTMGNAINWLEVGNPNLRSVSMTLVVRNRQGNVTHQEQRSVPPRSQTNFYVNPHIDPPGTGNVGSVEVSCDSSTPLLIQSAFYGRPATTSFTVSWAYVSQALGSPAALPGERLAGSVNTNLGAANWGKLSSGANASTSTVVSTFDLTGKVVGASNQGIASLGTLDYGVHSALGWNQVGTFSVDTLSDTSSLRGELLRVFLDPSGNIAEIMPTPLAVIEGSSTCSAGQCSGEFRGLSTSLSPYRAALSLKETRHLLGKVALGGSPELEFIGVQQGREALVNALVDYVEPSSVEDGARQHCAAALRRQ